jgi:hypothetical protein
MIAPYVGHVDPNVGYKLITLTRSWESGAPKVFSQNRIAVLKKQETTTMAEQQFQQPLVLATHVMYKGRRIENPYAVKCQSAANDARPQENDSLAIAANDARRRTHQPQPPHRRRGWPRKPQPPQPSNAFEEMMQSQAKKDGSKKSKMKRLAGDEPNDGGRKKPAVPRESGKENADELEALGGAKKKSSWNPSSLEYILSVRAEMVESVGFDERGTHEMYGEWPEFASDVMVSPPDPLLSAKSYSARDSIDPTYFSRPAIMFWGPELRWPALYPKGRPNCPFHLRSDCVVHDGWTFYPRRVAGESTNIALIARKHRCRIRQKEKEKPHNFLSTADEVIAQAPDFIQAYWNEHGFILTHRGAVSHPLMNQMRSLLAHGAGTSGFCKTLAEMYRNTYFNNRKMWHAFSDFRFNEPGGLSLQIPRTTFPEFGDSQYDVKVPSTTFLTSIAIREIERRIPYYKRKLEMVSGKYLSGDHSHKIAKVVLIEGKHGFQGLYTIMNEFGKIVGFWFVNSTNMKELEDRLRDLERRYRQHNFQGPYMLTVDDCCSMRGFFAGTNNAQKKPVFPTLVNNARNGGATTSTRISQPAENCQETPAAASSDDEPLMASIEVVQKHLILPFPPVQPLTMATAQTTAGTIARKVKEQGNVLFVDLEWTRNTKDGPGTVGIGLADGSVYLFHIPTLGGIPKGVTTLMEEESIKKVGNRFHNDIRKFREVCVEVKNTVELGRMAKE